MTTDFRALCAELTDALDWIKWSWNVPNQSALVERARNALAEPEPERLTDDEIIAFWSDHCAGDGDAGIIRLARWETPNSAETRRSLGEPADGEVAELATAEMVRQLRTKAATEKANRCHYSSKLLTRAADLLERLSPPQPVPGEVSERLPGHIEQALIKAECALADIAEGEAEESDGDPLEWAEKRAADALARIRPVMRQHQIQTSEWPPVPAHALPLPGEVEG